MNIKALLLSLFMLYSECSSHIFMREPIVRRSKYSSYYLSNNLVDYNLMAPLNTGNYEFPCKGFPVKKAISVITTDTIQVELEAVEETDKHKGGHCQFGISFDNENFLVLKQVIRNCVIDSLTYSVDIPRNIPDGKLIFFWTWINAVGNREYYMDCADIELSRKNIAPSISPIRGKKLLVVDLPGYKTIPEFPNKNSYDGSELLLNIEDMSLTPPSTYVTNIIGDNTSVIETTTIGPEILTTPFVTTVDVTTNLPTDITTNEPSTSNEPSTTIAQTTIDQSTTGIITTSFTTVQVTSNGGTTQSSITTTIPTISSGGTMTDFTTNTYEVDVYSGGYKNNIHINIMTFVYCIIFYSLF